MSININTTYIHQFIVRNYSIVIENSCPGDEFQEEEKR